MANTPACSCIIDGDIRISAVVDLHQALPMWHLELHNNKKQWSLSSGRQISGEVSAVLLSMPLLCYDGGGRSIRHRSKLVYSLENRKIGCMSTPQGVKVTSGWLLHSKGYSSILCSSIQSIKFMLLEKKGKTRESQLSWRLISLMQAAAACINEISIITYIQ